MAIDATNTRSDFYLMNKLGAVLRYTDPYTGEKINGEVVHSDPDEFSVLWSNDHKLEKYTFDEFSDSEIFGLSLAESKEQSIIDIMTAFIQGNPIEYRMSSLDGEWTTICRDEKVNWNFEVFDYRIKKLPPPPIVKMMFVEACPTLDNAYNKPNLKLTFDPITQALINAEIV